MSVRQTAVNKPSAIKLTPKRAIKKPQLTGVAAFNVVVPIIGFELMTYRLQGGCSTN
jgi:hypothetical protein